MTYQRDEVLFESASTFIATLLAATARSASAPTPPENHLDASLSAKCNAPNVLAYKLNPDSTVASMGRVLPSARFLTVSRFLVPQRHFLKSATRGSSASAATTITDPRSFLAKPWRSASIPLLVASVWWLPCRLAFL